MEVLSAADFVNPDVLLAQNPSEFGYHFGPIINHNEGWEPPSHVAHRLAMKRGPKPRITPEENDQAPTLGAMLSYSYTSLCEVTVYGSTTVMCGRAYDNSSELRKHMRDVHPGAVRSARVRKTTQQTRVGQAALKSHVLTGGWRRSEYFHDPGMGPPGSPVYRYAEACEQIAALDVQFAATFGTLFHRGTTSNPHLGFPQVMPATIYQPQHGQ